MNLTCGCGFAVSHEDREVVQTAYDEHECFEPQQPDPWHYSLFSFAGFMIVAMLIGGAVLIAEVLAS